MKIKLPKSIINGGLFSIFSFFNQGVSFILLIILAKYISPDEYGELSLYNTILTLLGYFIAFSTVGYEAITFFKNDKKQYAIDFSSIIVISTIVSSVLLIILLLFGNQLSNILSISKSFLCIAVVVSYTGIFKSLVLGYFRVSQNITNYGLISCSGAVLNFCLTLIFIICLLQGWQGRVYSQLVCSVFFAFLSVLIASKYRLFCFIEHKKDNYLKIISWGIPLIPHLGASWIRQGLDRYIIDVHYPITEVGLFSFALNLVSIINMIGIAFNNSFSVDIYQTLSSKLSSSQKIKSLKSKTKKMAIAYTIIYICVMISCSWLIPLFLPKYNASISYFWILSLYGYAHCLYFLVINYLFYYKKNKEIMYTTFFTAIIHLCLSLYFTKFSLYYTCIIYVVIQILVLLIIYKRSMKAIKENL